MEIRWNATSRQRWQQLAGANRAPQQDWAWGEASASLGTGVLRAEIAADGRALGILQLIHRPFARILTFAVGSRGPVWDRDAEPSMVAAALRQLVRTLPLPRLRGVFVTPDMPAATLDEAGFCQVMTPCATVELDLTRPPDTLRAAMHQKWRNRLVAAERARLTIKRRDRMPDAYRWLLEAEQDQQMRARYRGVSPALVPAWQQAGGGLRVLTAERNGETVAAMLFLLHGARATYHIGWSNEAGRKLSAHNLLLWTAMGKLGRAGVRTLDLGGLDTRAAPGLARFKLGSGGQVKTLSGTWFGR